MPVNVPAQHSHLAGYYKISRHFKWALSMVFDVLMFDQVIILEGTRLKCSKFYAKRRLLIEHIGTRNIQMTSILPLTFSTTSAPCFRSSGVIRRSIASRHGMTTERKASSATTRHSIAPTFSRSRLDDHARVLGGTQAKVARRLLG